MWDCRLRDRNPASIRRRPTFANSHYSSGVHSNGAQPNRNVRTEGGPNNRIAKRNVDRREHSNHRPKNNPAQGKLAWRTQWDAEAAGHNTRIPGRRWHQRTREVLRRVTFQQETVPQAI